MQAPSVHVVLAAGDFIARDERLKGEEHLVGCTTPSAPVLGTGLSTIFGRGTSFFGGGGGVARPELLVDPSHQLSLPLRVPHDHYNSRGVT